MPSNYNSFVKLNIHNVAGINQQEKMRNVAKLWREHKLKGGVIAGVVGKAVMGKIASPEGALKATKSGLTRLTRLFDDDDDVEVVYKKAPKLKTDAEKQKLLALEDQTGSRKWLQTKIDADKYQLQQDIDDELYNQHQLEEQLRKRVMQRKTHKLRMDDLQGSALEPDQFEFLRQRSNQDKRDELMKLKDDGAKKLKELERQLMAGENMIEKLYKDQLKNDKKQKNKEQKARELAAKYDQELMVGNGFFDSFVKGFTMPFDVVADVIGAPAPSDLLGLYKDKSKLQKERQDQANKDYDRKYKKVIEANKAITPEMWLENERKLTDRDESNYNRKLNSNMKRYAKEAVESDDEIQKRKMDDEYEKAKLKY